MPTRVIREGMLTSERVDQLSELAELFYRRLQQIVDDHGRYFAHPAQLRTNCFPVRIDRYTDGQVLQWRRECEAAGLVRVYRIGKVEYLEIADFRQQVKSKSKFPAPPPEGSPPTPVHDPYTARTRPDNEACTLDVVEDGVEDEGGGATREGAREPPPPLPDLASDDPIDPGRVTPIRAADRFDPTPPPTREVVIASWLIEQERLAGRQVRGISGSSPHLRSWVAAGVTDAEIADAYRAAVDARSAQQDRSPLNLGFIGAKLRDLREKAARRVAPLPVTASAPMAAVWEADSDAMLAKAAELGIDVNPDWTIPELRWHILQRLRSAA
jgi:hypothetical protein